MRPGGCQMGLASPVSIVCLTIFVRLNFTPCHEVMFRYLLSNERSFFFSLSVQTMYYNNIIR